MSSFCSFEKMGIVYFAYKIHSDFDAKSKLLSFNKQFQCLNQQTIERSTEKDPFLGSSLIFHESTREIFSNFRNLRIFFEVSQDKISLKASFNSNTLLLRNISVESLPLKVLICKNWIKIYLRNSNSSLRNKGSVLTFMLKNDETECSLVERNLREGDLFERFDKIYLSLDQISFSSHLNYRGLSPISQKKSSKHDLMCYRIVKITSEKYYFVTSSGISELALNELGETPKLIKSLNIVDIYSNDRFLVSVGNDLRMVTSFDCLLNEDLTLLDALPRKVLLLELPSDPDDCDSDVDNSVTLSVSNTQHESIHYYYFDKQEASCTTFYRVTLRDNQVFYFEFHLKFWICNAAAKTFLDFLETCEIMLSQPGFFNEDWISYDDYSVFTDDLLIKDKIAYRLHTNDNSIERFYVPGFMDRNILDDEYSYVTRDLST